MDRRSDMDDDMKWAIIIECRETWGAEKAKLMFEQLFPAEDIKATTPTE